MYIPISKVCSILGVSLSTVYRMLKQGILKESFRTEGNHRRFNVQEIHQIQRKTYEPRVVTYARVSSHDQKDDLTRQSNVLKSYVEAKAYHNAINSPPFGQRVLYIEDLGSGLNYKKKGFLKLVQMIFNHEFEILVINHRDRLLRFGVDLMEIICINHGVRLIVLEDKKKSFEETLTHDVIELMTVFCAKLYGKRSHNNKRKVIV